MRHFGIKVCHQYEISLSGALNMFLPSNKCISPQGQIASLRLDRIDRTGNELGEENIVPTTKHSALHKIKFYMYLTKCMNDPQTCVSISEIVVTVKQILILRELNRYKNV